MQGFHRALRPNRHSPRRTYEGEKIDDVAEKLANESHFSVAYHKFFPEGNDKALIMAARDYIIGERIGRDLERERRLTHEQLTRRAVIAA